MRANTLAAFSYLIDLYDAWGKPEKAAEWRAKRRAKPVGDWW